MNDASQRPPSTGAETYEFEMDERTMLEGMLRGSAAIRMGFRSKGMMTMLSCVSAMLMMLGGAAFFNGAYRMVTDTPPGSVVGFLGFATGLWLALGWYDRLLRQMAGSICATSFNQGLQKMTFGPEGVTLENHTARWTTAWAGVNGVRRGPHGVHVSISGIILALPMSALASEEDADALVQRIEDWRAAAAA